MRAPEILVVEDDTGIRQTIAECLELEGYVVRQAASGPAALDDVARRGAPALVFLDIVMPSMDGQQVLKRLRQDPATAALPVVVMTAAVPSLTGPIDGATAMLSKPFDLAQLLATVSFYCGPPPPTAAAGAPG